MFQLSTSSLIVAFGLAIIGLLVTLILYLANKMDKLGDKLAGKIDEIPDKLDELGDKLAKKIDEVPDKFWGRFIDAYKLMMETKKNPGSEERKKMLLEKLKARTISREEAVELSEVLKKEAEEREKQGDFLGFLIIVGILILLASLLSKE